MLIKNLLLFLSVISFSSITLADKITYIGDSQSAVSYGLLGQLSHVLQSEGHEITSGRAVCSAMIDDYISAKGGRCKYTGVTYMDIKNSRPIFPQGRGATAPVEDLMKGSDAVVVQLGDNHLGDPAGASKKAKELAKKILSSGKKCIWIGPASATAGKCSKLRSQKEAVSKSIKEVLSSPEFIAEMNGKQCRFVDSFELTKNSSNIGSAGDCLHYKSYSTWAKSIAGELTSALGDQINANYLADDQNQTIDVVNDNQSVSAPGGSTDLSQFFSEL